MDPESSAGPAPTHPRLKSSRSRFWISGRVYAEDNEHSEPHHAVHPKSGTFGRVIDCRPDENDMITFEFELPMTKKDPVNPFLDGGLGGEIYVRIPDPYREKTAAFDAKFLRFESHQATRPAYAEDHGSFTAKSYCLSHPTLGDIEIAINWMAKKNEVRVTSVRVQMSASDWDAAYEGALYMIGIK